MEFYNPFVCRMHLIGNLETFKWIPTNIREHGIKEIFMFIYKTVCAFQVCFILDLATLIALKQAKNM